jgi:hypothetical protein
MNIIITDDQTNSAVIGAGRLPRGAGLQVQSAFQIQGWIETNNIFLGGPGGAAVATQPFAIGSGDCLFDTGSLFCFAGPQNSNADNVLMVLWGFQLHPASGNKGTGQLNSPPSAGALDGGSIGWQVV